MSRIRNVGGKIIKTTGGNHKIYSEGNIVQNALGSITEIGEEKGVNFLQPERAPEPPKPKKKLYLLFFVDEDHKGKKMLAEAAQTRLQNIKRKPWYDDNMHKAFCIPIQSIDEIITQVTAIINNHGGKEMVLVQEIGVFSHAGGDGPISYEKEVVDCPADPNWKHQMAMCGWEKVDAPWSTENPICVFYGCNTGNTSPLRNNFALNISNLSNFENVEIWGQSTFSFPSLFPHRRKTTVDRSIPPDGYGWAGPTYMVGGNPNEGASALLLPLGTTVTPFNVYKNGTHVKSTDQGAFNSHF